MECNKYFLAIIIWLASLFSDLYLFIGHRGLISQNKMDFPENLGRMYLIRDSIASS